MDKNKKIERNMVLFYNSLSEKDRRRYAAIEAEKYGYGGTTHISTLFGCDEKTIRKGIAEFDDKELMNQQSIRSSGGGRNSIMKKIENINDIFLDVLADHTAGNPMKEDVKWTNLTKAEIIVEMGKRGIKISKNIVRKLLKKNKFVKRKAQKSTSTTQHKERDKQFKKIKKARKEYENSDNPIISIDTKKVEQIGNLYRDGKIECVEPIEVYDHDFPSLSIGKIIPYTVFDIKSNEAFVYIGTSFDTSELSCDAIKMWWKTLGKNRYPYATSILCLADGGGSNSSHSDLFKSDLQSLSNNINLDLRIAHYPPGASKWNPVEHKVFPHITRSLSGVILKSINLAQELINKTSTTTGLKVFSRISKKIYQKGRSVAENFYTNAKIIYDNTLGDWNYMVFHDA
jgi:Rhodopirellula transposase DDE domain